MAEELTKQQEEAVKNRGGKLLVSAAAGSGKTKVRVDRLMSYLMDPTSPANLDEFLIITYTKAAAAELRGKIASKLSDKMAENPENRHLQRQMQRLYLAKITTVHSFCGDILREYAYLVDLPADFRVADENECMQIRENCMAKCLDEAYAHSDDPDFRSFVDTQGLGRNDRLVPEILMKVYDSARCHLEPDKWLSKCIQNAETSGVTDAGQTIWGAYLMRDLQEHLRLQIEALRICEAEADQTETMEKPAQLLRDTIFQLEHLRSANSWDEIVQRRDIRYGTLTFSKKCPDLELRDRMKAVRKACKDSLEKKLKVFVDPSDVVLEELNRSASAVRGMVKLVEAFGKAYDDAKRARRILDFGDLEHKMLDLLLGKSRSGHTLAAREIGDRFREIMVDEYQDSNGVQDAIFSALTEKRQNCFMVGDVKQSIYQFRLADPGIFLEKYNTYANAEDAVDGEGRRVMLSKNFRSGGAVLEGVNDVFRACMSPEVGGLVYGKDEELSEGFAHTPLGEPEVELWTIPVNENTYQEEAEFVAQRISQLLDGSHMVRDKAGDLRPIRIDDIAILLRSPGSVGWHYKEALANLGIPCNSGGGNDLLQTQEIAVLRSLLQTISNPRQDIPLIATLASPIFCVTADELAQIRGDHPWGCMYEALKKSELPKIKEFMENLSRWRREARLQPLAQLLESIFAQTRMDSLFGAMADGTVRRENLQTFYQLAIGFEKTGRRDLEQFLDHLDALSHKGLIVEGTQAGGAVTIMSIHKSKGLEFPVVFVCALSRSFNRESTRAQVLCDKDLGLGLAAVDEKLRVRYPTIAKRAIAAKMNADSLSEEMRVLYVALTRARDRLIMTYSTGKLAEELSDIALRMDVGSRELLTKDVSSCGEWILMAALRRTEAGELFQLGSYPKQTELGNPPWLIRVVNGESSSGKSAAEDVKTEVFSTDLAQRLQKTLNFQYPHMAATQAPSKQTATQLKGRAKDNEAKENVPVSRAFSHLQNRKKGDGALRGTAMHAVLQYISYDKCANTEGSRQEIQRLVSENYITAQQGDLVDPVILADFFESDLGAQLRNHSNVLREFKFSIVDDAGKYDPALAGEEILLQGVVDCAMVDSDGITVIDFKTDYVTEDTLAQKVEQYSPQVKAYADAIGRIYGKNVKSAWLYFFHLGKFQQITI